ncbi:DNA cytosine methyltransferase [Stenotrophomonas sp. 2MCAF14_2]|uniref:DNA cytosine methyltransferase n=1 Tax=Stenotrophomonas sp. 2MCAF14_2 TaxID=3232983 RepID=UPI003F96D2AD
MGAARAGFDVRLAVELDARAAAAHACNFPSVAHLNQDVSALDANGLLHAAGLKYGELDGIIGGPPCQGFSVIGKRDSGDSRNNLFGHFVRLVIGARPRFFVAENVVGILHDRNRQVLDGMLAPLHEDYELHEPIMIRASDIGAPTSRTRVFFVGVLRASGLNVHALGTDAFGSHIGINTVRHALRGLPATVEEDWKANISGRARLHAVANSLYQEKLRGDRPVGIGCPESLRLLDKGIVLNHQGTVHSAELRMRYDSLGPGEQDYKTKSVRLRPDGFCPTLRAGTGADRGSFQAVRPIHPRMPRVITPREAARLQSFPDWFHFDRTKWQAFRQIGNSVPPVLAEVVFNRIRKSVLKT